VIEDTSRRDAALHAVPMLDGATEYITGMEAAGQRQLVASAMLPTEGSGALADLGFVLGDIDQDDPLFRGVTLPTGWAKTGSDHAMWSYVVDEHGRRRVAVFYKAAFYDRRAQCTVESVYSYLSHATYEGHQVVLDDTWCTADAIRDALPGILEQAERMVAGRFNTGGVYTRQVAALRHLHERVLAGGAE
jgi:hypothetical protein